MLLKITIPENLFLFMRPNNRKHEIDFFLERKASVKDIIESLGIPHTEIGHIFAAGREVDFGFIPERSQRIRIAAIQPPFDVFRPSLLRPEPLREIRFIADINVAKLASLLRMLGFDTAYSPRFSDRRIAQVAEKEKRIVLSKDIELFKRKQITFGRRLRAVRPDDQLVEVIRFFDLNGPFHPFSRCLNCNTPLERVQKQDIVHRLEPKTRKYFTWFKICRQCDQIFWRGSHFDEMRLRLQKAGIRIAPPNQR